MKAIRLKSIGQVTVDELSPPCPPDGARINVHSAGICGSDLHNFKTGKWIAHLPVTPGHELFGVIRNQRRATALPARHARSRFPDSRVYCGHCAFCSSGAMNLCESLGFVGEVFDGGFAEQVALPLSSLLAVPDAIPDEIAVLSEPLGVALRVVNPTPNPRRR
ncbi:alcohol dehydrogenase catalytic domain-containing protein (plasmid) [Pseudomonas silvicola]|nr:alcohol dehydrogenase catalytic domain-containing protein [Pseudomonas silvicola]